MQILASDIIQEYVLKQMLIRTVNADNLMSVKSSTELMLDVVLSMPTLNKDYLLFIYLLSIIDKIIVLLLNKL
jgi:hypothetical protein